MNMVQALNSAMDVNAGARSRRADLRRGCSASTAGVFRCTEGLQKKYGEQRVFDTPIAEGGMLATAVGMGAYGLRPIVEIQFADYIYPATDQLISEAARLRYRSGGEFWAPITVRRPAAAHLRRPDAQPERRGAVHTMSAAENGDPVEPVRRQGPC